MRKSIVFSTRWYERRIHLGVLRYAQEQRWVVQSSHHMPSLVWKAPDAVGQIVEIGHRDRRRLRMAQEFDGPVVGLEDFGDGLEIPRVHTDNTEVGRLAARHLLDRNFRRFATVRKDSFQSLMDRLAGFHGELEPAVRSACLNIRAPGGAPPAGPLPWDRDAKSLELILDLERPIGIFCPDDEVALHLIDFLDQHQVAVPEEIAVVGVNNDPLICPFAPVPLSSVDPGFDDVGYRAAQLLDRMMQGESVSCSTHLIPPTGVVTRRSSDIQAVEDVSVAKALRYIWDRAEESVSVGEIATYVGLPVRTLQWKFRKRMGYPLQNEMTKSRVERVKHELLNTTKSAAQIAEELNFSSVKYMIRVFSKETGLPPVRFRRQYEGAPVNGVVVGAGGVADAPGGVDELV